jgi:hypothetical protein
MTNSGPGIACCIVQPAAAYDEFFAEVPDMGDRSAERGETQFEEYP